MDVFKLIEKHGIELHGDIEYFAELIRQDERDACVEILENHPSYDFCRCVCECTEAVRSRGQQ